MRFGNYADYFCGFGAALLFCVSLFEPCVWAAGLPREPSTSATSKPLAKVAASPVGTASRSGKGWKTGPLPRWVVAPPSPQPGLAAAPNAGSRRDELLDIQVNHALPKTQIFVRVRAVALESSALGQVSQPQITFNPAFQTVMVHSVAVFREGRRSERLADVRIESMRREQRLEQQSIDGNDTLLLVVNDVRVGEPVEISYTLEGENPIFEGRISWTMTLANEMPIELMHHRLIAPAARKLHTKSLAGNEEVERLIEGPNQVLRVVRHQVPGMPLEPQVPPWVKFFPAIHVSDYSNWGEVDSWARRLFALPQPTPPEVMAKAAGFRASGLKDEALVSEVLRFVQDEVRYFSVSLGESSHRPKAPQTTLADLVGDCKDKVQLLNALLRELGFDAKPALVSVFRHRGIRDFLPSHDVFDHVISKVELNGRTWYLDPTINGQGLTLETRGRVNFGSALVVGAGTELQTLPEPPAALDRVTFDQTWDLTQPGHPAQLITLMRAQGYLAERWRAYLAGAGKEKISQSLAGSFARLLPGLKVLGEIEINDDRIGNQIEFRHRFETAEFGRYNRGFIDTEFLALELWDVLSGPAEMKRRSPFMVDQPRQVESRIVVSGPGPFTFNVPAPIEVVDRQFRYLVRMELQGNKATFMRRYDRTEAEVPASALMSWREKILQARQTTSGRLRLPLLDGQKIRPELQTLERRLRNSRGWRDDNLSDILLNNEFGRVIDTHALARVPADSVVAARILTSRATSQNLLADFAAARSDADRALTIKPDDAEALDTRGVALFGEGKAEEALENFARIPQQDRNASVTSWMAQIQFYLGRYAEAESLMREAVAKGAGTERDYALLWLYLSAERQGGRGKAAVAEHLENVDAKKFIGAILRFLTDSIDSDALLRQASEEAKMTRLNLAEAHFFIGQKRLIQGRRDDALIAFQRAVDTQASPYREVTYARMELQRAQAPGR